MTGQKSSNQLDYQHIDRAIGAMPKEYPDGYFSAPHAHRRGQLIHATQGVMEVSACGRSWFVAPNAGLWLPAGVVHSTRMRGRVSLRTIYVEEAGNAPLSPTLVAVGPFLNQLLIRATEAPMHYDPQGADGLVAELLMKEIDWTPLPVCEVAVPRDARLLKLYQHYVQAPADSRSLSDWGRALGASERTLSRVLQHEVGCSFTDWRQSIRLAIAMTRLMAGAPVNVVANEVGYHNASAFTAVFKRLLGLTPRQYMQQAGAA